MLLVPRSKRREREPDLPPASGAKVTIGGDISPIAHRSLRHGRTEVLPVLINQAPCPAGVGGSGGIAPPFWITVLVSGQLHAPFALPPGTLWILV
jgi:hypothetical protein